MYSGDASSGPKAGIINQDHPTQTNTQAHTHTQSVKLVALDTRLTLNRKRKPGLQSVIKDETKRS